MALAELLEKGRQRPLAEMIGYVAQRLMQMDVDGWWGGHGERGEGPRTGATATGAGLAYAQRHDRLRIPKLRRGSYFPAFLEPRRSSRRRWRGGAGSLRPGISTRSVESW